MIPFARKSFERVQPFLSLLHSRVSARTLINCCLTRCKLFKYGHSAGYHLLLALQHYSIDITAQNAGARVCMQPSRLQLLCYSLQPDAVRKVCKCRYISRGSVPSVKTAPKFRWARLMTRSYVTIHYQVCHHKQYLSPSIIQPCSRRESVGNDIAISTGVPARQPCKDFQRFSMRRRQRCVCNGRYSCRHTYPNGAANDEGP